LKKLGKYEVLGELGHGAMGVVYRARDPIINRLVALKTITTGLASDPGLLERFYREAQSAGGLQHPNIVTIYDMGEAGDLPYIAMELVEGENLEQVIARKLPLPLTLKLTYAMQACRAFDYAHKRGIVHRDIKPGNVMLGKDGTVKVVDFGIARVLENSKTQTGMLIGTFAYMSPEQYHGEHADERSDIWSFGVLLYELLTYQRPFVRPTPAGLMNAICNEEPPPLNTHIPDIPAELQPVVSKVLQKSPSERYQSMEDLLLELDPVLRTLQSQFVVDLVAQSRQLLEQNEYSQARDLLRQALQAESSNSQARSLLEKANAGVRRQLNRPKAQQCLERAQTLLDEGKLQQARIEAEHSLEFDSTFAPGIELQHVILERLERAKQISEWLEAAKQRLAEGMPEEAESQLAQVLQAEPSNAEAIALQRQAQRERIERERLQRVSDGLRRGRELWTQQNFAECVNVLGNLEQEFPEEEEVRRLLETVREDQAEQQRQQGLAEARNLLAAGRHEDSRARLIELQQQFPRDEEIVRHLEDVRRDQAQQRRLQGLSEARNLLNDGQFDKSAAALNSLLKEFSDDSEISRLLETVHQNQAQHHRLQGLTEARNLLNGGQFERSASALSSLLKEFPGDTEISRLIETVHQTRAQHRRLQSLTEARNLLSDGQFDKSASALSSLLKEFPGDSEISRLLETVHQNQAEQRRQAAYSQARSLLSARRYDEASAFLKRIEKDFPGDQEIANLQRIVREEQAQQQRRKSLEEARSALTAGRYDESLSILANLERQFPGDTEVVKLQTNVREDKAKQRKMQQLDQARALLASKNYETALQLLSALQQEFPQESDIRHLIESARNEQAEERKREGVAQARNFLTARRYDEAIERLRKLQREFSDDKSIAKLLESAKKEQAEQIKRDGLTESRKLLNARRHDEGIALLSKLQTEFPADTDISKALAAARAEGAENVKQQKMAEARALLASQSFARALSLLDELAAAYPKDTAVTKFRALVQREHESTARAKKIQKELDGLKMLMAEKKYPEVAARAKDLLAEFPTDPNVIRLAEFAKSQQAEIEKEKLLRKTIDEAKTLFDAGKYEDAIRVAQGGLKTFPANSELLSIYQQSEVQGRKQEVRQEIERRIREIKVKINREKFSEAIDLAEETLVTMGPDTDLSQLLTSARVEIEARDRKRMQERTLQTIRTMMNSGDFEGATEKIKEVIDSKILEPYDPRVQRLAEQIHDAKTTPPAAPQTSSHPALSKEYAFLQATPIPEDPPAIDKNPPAESPSQQSSATQSISWTPPAPPPQIRITPAAPAKPAEPPSQTRVEPPAPAAPVAPRLVAPVVPPPIPSAPAVAEPAAPAPAPHPEPAAPAEKKLSRAARRAERHRAHTAEVTREPEPIARPVDFELSKPVFKRTPVLIGAAVVLVLGAWATIHFVGSSQPDSPITRVADSDNKPASSTLRPTPATATPSAPAPDPAEAKQKDAIALSDKLMAAGNLHEALEALRGAERPGGPLSAEIRGRENTIAKLENSDAMTKLWAQADKELEQRNFADAKRDLQKLAASDDGPRRAEAQKDLSDVLPRRQKEEDLFQQAQRSSQVGNQRARMRAKTLLEQVIALNGPRKAEATNLQRQVDDQIDNFRHGKDPLQNPPAATQAVPPQVQPPPAASQEAKDWAQASNSNDSSQLEQYLSTYPNGTHTQEAQSKLQDLAWNRISLDDANALDDYIKRFPSSSHASEATRRVDDLRWSNTSKNSTSALNDFLSRYPGSSHRADAQAQLNQLVAANNTKAASTNAPTAPSPAPAPIAKTNSEADIRTLIQQYSDAYTNRDADALRKIWPTMGSKYDKVKANFASATAIREQVNIESIEISPDGSKAMVKGHSNLVFTLGKQSRENKGTRTFLLSRSNGVWTINDVQ
jgi:eukaryotic-like serine/threonine-protein kinase